MGRVSPKCESLPPQQAAHSGGPPACPEVWPWRVPFFAGSPVGTAEGPAHLWTGTRTARQAGRSPALANCEAGRPRLLSPPTRSLGGPRQPVCLRCGVITGLHGVRRALNLSRARLPLAVNVVGVLGATPGWLLPKLTRGASVGGSHLPQPLLWRLLNGDPLLFAFYFELILELQRSYKNSP